MDPEPEQNAKTLITLFWKKRLVISTVTTIAAVISIIISLILPEWYRSTAVIMPPTTEQSGMGIASMLSGLPFGGLGLDAASQATNNYLSILNSRTLNEKVIDRFNLIESYESEDIDQALEALSGNTKFIIRDEGTISITVYDRRQDRVAEIANYYVTLLDSINKEMAIERASNNRQFIEHRLDQVYKETAKAEDALRRFQETEGVYSIEVQAEESIRNLATIDAKIIEKQIELDYLKSTMGKNRPEIDFKRKEIKALREGLNQFVTGQKQGEVLSPLEKMPELMVNYGRLYREVKAKNAVLEFLLPEYEQARIREAKDSPTVQVLDTGKRPFRKAKPFRALIVALSTLSAFIIVLYLLVFLDRYYKPTSTRNH